MPHTLAQCEALVAYWEGRADTSKTRSEDSLADLGITVTTDTVGNLHTSEVHFKADAMSTECESAAFTHDPEPASPSVLKLIQSPAVVLGDRKRWPTAEDIAQSEIEARVAYREWLGCRARDAGGKWKAALQLWRLDSEGTPVPLEESQALQWMLKHVAVPFPVGQACPEFTADPDPEDDSEHGTDPDSENRLPTHSARVLMPFPDDVHAALIVSEQINGTGVTLFFLAEIETFSIGMARERIEAGTRVRATGTVRRIVDGNPDDPEVQSYFEAAQEWWADIAGKPFRRGPGRPKGDVTWTPEIVWDRLVEYQGLPVDKRRRTDAKPRLQDFLGYINMHRNTWDTLKKEWGWTWAELRDAVYETPDKSSR